MVEKANDFIIKKGDNVSVFYKGTLSLYYNFCSISSGLPSGWSETSGTTLTYGEAPYGLEISPSQTISGWYGLFDSSSPLGSGQSLMAGADFYGDNNAGGFIGFDTASTPGGGSYAYGMSLGEISSYNTLYASYIGGQYESDTGVTNNNEVTIYYLPYIETNTGSSPGSDGPYTIEEDYRGDNNADQIWTYQASTGTYADNYLLFDVSNNGGGEPAYPIYLGFYAIAQSPYGSKSYTSSISSYGPGLFAS